MSKDTVVEGLKLFLFLTLLWLAYAIFLEVAPMIPRFH